MFASKRLASLYLRPSTISLMSSEIQLINQSYQVFLISVFYFITFCLNLSLSFIDTTIGLILYLLINLFYKGLFFTFKKSFAYYLSNLSQCFRFFNLNVSRFLFLYVYKKKKEKRLKFLKYKNAIIKAIQVILKKFQVITRILSNS